MIMLDHISGDMLTAYSAISRAEQNIIFVFVLNVFYRIE
jgi:hypothetical protein